MKKVIFDISPLGSFQFSCETYMMYYREKYGQDIFFYTRKNGKYVKVEDLEELKHLKSRVILNRDLGSEVDFIAHDLDARVKPLTEELEDDELLINIVERLGDNASWKNSKMRVVELQECWLKIYKIRKEKRFLFLLESLIFLFIFWKLENYFFDPIFWLPCYGKF